MPRTNFQELLDAGVHFGHLKRKWNPKMAPYIFMERNGIHIIDLHKTVIKIDEAANVMKQLARAGRKILFVATKKQAKDIVAEKSKAVNMPYVTERWPGGMLTNFPTIRKAVKKMNTIDKMMVDGTYETLAKREKLQVTRQRAKLEKNLGSIADLNRLPSALFIIDIQKEMNAVKEANRLNIPVIAMVDTCCDPGPIDYVIPANDDAAKSISLVMEVICQAITEGLSERKLEKEKEASSAPEAKESGDNSKKIRPRKGIKGEEKPEVEAAPAAVAAAPVAVEDAPVAVKEAPAVVAETPAAVEEAPAVVEAAPVVVEEAPAVEEAAPAAEPEVKAE
jgi:small subunit ribosomal protein S2